MRVKICGMTRVQDADLAAELGAWAVGFIFWPGSPRCVDAPSARALANRLPATVTRVGVFVDQPAAHVEEVASLVGLDLVQLHGRERPAYARSLARPIIKAVSLEQAQAQHTLAAWADAMLMIDGRDQRRPEAGGRTVDWAAAAQVAERREIVLAGGLCPDNVAAAIRTVRPHAIDVSSGVERAPGEKDAALMRALFEAVADAGRGVE